jgi:hypothetical protein
MRQSEIEIDLIDDNRIAGCFWVVAARASMLECALESGILMKLEFESHDCVKLESQPRPKLCTSIQARRKDVADSSTSRLKIRASA